MMQVRGLAVGRAEGLDAVVALRAIFRYAVAWQDARRNRDGSADTSTAEDRRISAAAAVAAANPVLRLTVRRSPLKVAVPMAELLVRIVDIADNLTSGGGRVSRRKLVRARTLSHDVARGLDRTLGLDFDLDLDRTRAFAQDLARIRASARALAANLEIDHAFYRDRAFVLDRVRVRVLNLVLILNSGHNLGLRLNVDLDRVRYRDRAFDLACDVYRVLDVDLDVDLAPARELASVLAGTLSDSLGIEHRDALADALLDGALDDFSQADLSEANPDLIGLAGVRWSVQGTRLPDGLDAETLMRQSKETEPGSGIYVVTRRGETESAREEAHV